MGLIKPSEPQFMTAEAAARRGNFGRAAQSELALRNALEEFCRARWTDVRICHEMVMGEGRTRADVVAIGTAGIAAFEVKGAYDETSRLMHQVGWYQLSVPEVWMVVAENHDADARLMKHLLPSVGILVGTSGQFRYEDGRPPDYTVTLAVEAESAPRPVHVECMLEMLWRAELQAACNRTRCFQATQRTTRKTMIAALIELPVAELQREVCIELRARVALWRADPPIVQGAAP